MKGSSTKDFSWGLHNSEGIQKKWGRCRLLQRCPAPTVCGEDVAEHSLQLRGGRQLPQHLSQALGRSVEERGEAGQQTELVQNPSHRQRDHLQQDGVCNPIGHHLGGMNQKNWSPLWNPETQSPTKQPSPKGQVCCIWHRAHLNWGLSSVQLFLSGPQSI